MRANIARSVDSRPPTFDAGLHLTSTMLGAGRGDPLGLLEDYAGKPLPPTDTVDIGAYEVQNDPPTIYRNFVAATLNEGSGISFNYDGGFDQFISATRGERWIIVIGLVGSALGFALNLANGGLT